MCVTILRSIGTKLTNLEFRYFDQEHFETSLYDFRFNSYGSNSGHHVLLTLTLTFDICSIFVTRTMKYMNLHANYVSYESVKY